MNINLHSFWFGFFGMLKFFFSLIPFVYVLFKRFSLPHWIVLLLNVIRHKDPIKWQSHWPKKKKTTFLHSTIKFRFYAKHFGRWIPKISLNYSPQINHFSLLFFLSVSMKSLWNLNIFDGFRIFHAYTSWTVWMRVFYDNLFNLCENKSR